MEPPKIRKTIPELCLSLTTNGVVLDCNIEYAKRLGYGNAKQVIGQSIFENVPSGEQVILKSFFKTCKQTDKIINRRIKMIQDDGTEFVVLLTATNRYDESGALIGIHAVLRDISELKELQNLIMQKKYESLYENSPDLYRTVNSEGIIIDCNQSYAKRLGYAKDEIIGSNLLEHTALEYLDMMRENLDHWRKTAETPTVQVWMKTKDDRSFPAKLTPTNLYDDKGFLIGRNVVIQDVTELIKTQEDLNELEKVDLLKEEFASMIAHELKTPLSPIMGYCDMLLDPELLGKQTPQQNDAVKIIRRNSLRLEKLVSDILDAQKLDMGKMTFNYDVFHLLEFLNEVRDDLLPLMTERNIEFTLTDSCSSKITVNSDKNRLRQVMDNLVRNAVDFVSAKDGKIGFGAYSENNKIVFFVKDNGVGISKDDQMNIFKKFYQADTSSKRKHGGTGLGLVVCKGIVESLGGTIEVESTKGEGTMFTFYIHDVMNS